MRDGFDTFCCELLSRPNWRRFLSPAALAKEFVHHFGLSGFPRFRELEGILVSAGIGEIAAASLPEGLRGIHYGQQGGQYAIHYAEDEWQGSWEHTVLHETYEIIQERLQDMCPEYQPPKEKRLCSQADRFAAVVLLQPDLFSLFAESTGFDVVALQRAYQRAYASIVLRLAEVMRHQPLLVALYERTDGDGRKALEEPAIGHSLVAKVVVRTPGFTLALRGRAKAFPRHCLPVRGTIPAPGSAAERVIKLGSPVYVDRVSGYDLWGLGDVSVAAQPVLWDGQVAKVAVVAVPHRDRLVLAPQLERRHFHRVQHAFQVV